MVNWTEGNEVKLLLAVIEHLSQATVPGGTWQIVAGTLGPDFTAEGCRQKFAGLKRSSVATAGVSVSTAANTVGQTTPTKARRAARSASSAVPKGKKRGLSNLDPNSPTPRASKSGKAAVEASISDDDDQNPMSKKQKRASTDDLQPEERQSAESERTNIHNAGSSSADVPVKNEDDEA